MKFDARDKIKDNGSYIHHESAGGFVFFEEPSSHELSVALLETASNTFVIPKGHLRKGENAEETAAREIKEELSLSCDLKLISFLGIDSYIFNLDDNKEHRKDVHLYIFQVDKLYALQALTEEGLIEARWFPFHEAVNIITFDKENLLKARQLFYFNKTVPTYKSLSDIRSITIAMPTYNGGFTIQRTLISVIEELNKISPSIRKEIIVCTDHCTDRTAEIVDHIIHEQVAGEDIIIYRIENKGIKGKADALNEIFKKSKGEFICIVDDDVLLKKNSFIELLRSLISDHIRLVFASWERIPLKKANPWKKFWHWILGIKFEIQPYDKKSEIARGACLMLRREDYVQIPQNIVNEDQYLQYFYWPHTLEATRAVLYFNSVSSISDYFKRFIRITWGNKQLEEQFSRDKITECKNALYRKISYKKVLKLPWKYIFPFILYRVLRYFINLIVKIRFIFKKDYEWFRIKQS